MVCWEGTRGPNLQWRRLFYRGTMGRMVDVVMYRQVVRVLGAARDPVLERFAALGGDRDRWHRVDRERMAEALTRTEDEWERDAGRSRDALAARAGMQRVRRALEVELWP